MIYSFCFSLLKDIIFREPLLLIKHYNFNKRKSNPIYVLMVDGRTAHGGMFDRFKGIITIYALSKIKNIPFKINYIYPFNLDEYLLPNKYNWKIIKNEIDYSFPFAKPIIGYGEYRYPFRIINSNIKKQIHFYYGYNSIDYINQKFKTKFLWNELFNELFKPSEKLQNILNKYKESINGNYISIHFRFQNLLGDNVEKIGTHKILNVKEREILINSCKDQINKLLLKNNFVKKAFIASDSNIFIENIKNMNQIFMTEGKSIHIDNESPKNIIDSLKPFVDFYLISESIYAYSVGNKDMYFSDFPKYAAMINNVKFERIIFN